MDIAVSPRPMEILLVEDDPDDAFLVQEMLTEVETSSFQLTHVGRLQDALEKLDEDNFDVVLLDLTLPDSNGLETFTQARAAANTTAIVVMTGIADEDLAHQALRQGAQDYLIKGRSDGSVLGRAIRFAIDRLQADEKRSRDAHYDQLTRVPNRVLFQDRLHRATARAERRNTIAGVLVIDLDYLKDVNDTLGYEIGNQLLKVVAKRLQKCLREVDTVARWGGDEFAVIVEDLSRGEDTALIAQKILDVIDQPFRIEQHEVQLTASIGIAVYPDHAAAELLNDAATAMYLAKENGRNGYQFFTQEMQNKAARRAALESYLYRALKCDEFELHYQPLIELQGERIVGVEALLRWQQSEIGAVSPAEFIPLAEKTGLIIPIGEWVVRNACMQCQAWHKAGLPPLKVAVNVSARQMRQRNFAEVVSKALNDSGLEPSYLELEITESMIMDHTGAITKTLETLRSMGVKISLDDFGTGHSSLRRLLQLPIDILKIDQSFLRDVDTDPTNAALSTAIISLCHALGKKAVAEGVETQQQLDFLRQHDLQVVQGFLFSRPLPASILERCLREGIALPHSDTVSSLTSMLPK